MEITVNGKPVDTREGICLMDFIKEKGLEPERIVIEYNSAIAGREEWDEIFLKEKDCLEVLKFMGGG